MGSSAARPGDASSLPLFLGPTGVAVIVVDHRGTIVGWTSAAEALTGLGAEATVGKPVISLLAEPTSLGGQEPRLREPPWVRGSLNGRGNHWSGLREVRHGSGRVLGVNVEAVPLEGRNGEDCWFLWVTALADSTTEPSVGGSVMRTLLDHSPLALAIWDTDLRCVWLNTTAEQESGAFRRRQIGMHMNEVLHGFDTRRVESVMRRVIEDGMPVIDHEFDWMPGDGRDASVYSASFYRLDSSLGKPAGVCTIAMDTSRSWARARLSLVSRASRSVGTTLDIGTTAQELADVFVPHLADFAAVDLAEPGQAESGGYGRLTALDDLVSTADRRGGARGNDAVPLYRRAALASVRDQAPEAVYQVGEVLFVRPTSPFYRAALWGETTYEPYLRAAFEEWETSDPERVAVTRLSGVHSLLVVPLRARGVILGVAVLGRTENQTPFSRDDLVLAEELCMQAGLSIDNARRYTRERTAALALQRNLLPSNLSGGTALEIAHRYLPTDRYEGVGGDWFDVIRLPGARTVLAIGDVVGHGIHAAAAMGRMRTAVGTLAVLDLPPAEVLAHLDDLVVRLTSSQSADDPDFPAPPQTATCVYAVYDAVTRICTLARAGHPPPAIVAPDGSVSFPDLPAGTPIGVGYGGYESVDLELPEGSIIALYTDGLIERRTSDLDEGLATFAHALARREDGLDDMCSAVVAAMTEGLHVEDDVALLLARTQALGADQVASWTLVRGSGAAGRARRLVRARLAGWGLGHLAARLDVVVGALVSASVRHGGEPVTLRLIRHTTLVCEVSDGGCGQPAMRHGPSADVDEELAPLQEAADHWGCRWTATEQIAWAAVDAGGLPS